MGFWNKLKDFWLSKGDNNSFLIEEKVPRQLQEETSRPRSEIELYYEMLTEFVNSYGPFRSSAREAADALIFEGREGYFTLDLGTYKLVLISSESNYNHVTFQGYTNYTLRRDGKKVHYERDLFLNLYDDCKQDIVDTVAPIVYEFNRLYKKDHPYTNINVNEVTILFKYFEY